MVRSNRRLLITLVALAAVVAGILLIHLVESGKENDIKIGVIFPLTGPAAYLGETTLNAVEMAADEINASGELGDRKLTIIAGDSKADPKEAVTVFRNLSSLHNLTAVYCLAAADTFAVAPLSNRMNMPFFTGTIAPGAADLGDYVFRNASNLSNDAEMLAELCVKKLGLKRVALLAVNLPIIPALEKAFSQKLESLGGTFLGTEYGNLGETDFRTQLTKIKAMSPDAIYCIGYKEIGYMLKQARELGLDVTFLGAAGMESQDIIEIAGSAADGAIYTQADDNLAQTFLDAYKKRFGKIPDVNAAQAYDTIMILASVIDKKNLASDELRSEILEIKNYQGVTGLTSFLPNGDTNKKPIFKTIKDGKFVPYHTAQQQERKSPDK
jgi:branched-chain amino acid transport system substrate-binding protein